MLEIGPGHCSQVCRERANASTVAGAVGWIPKVLDVFGRGFLGNVSVWLWQPGKGSTYPWIGFHRRIISNLP